VNYDFLVRVALDENPRNPRILYLYRDEIKKRAGNVQVRRFGNIFERNYICSARKKSFKRRSR